MASHTPPYPKDYKPQNLDRKTRAGRNLRYELGVLQQPHRARACGSGAKSSSDRRPVDPPPVVKLRILDMDNDQADITFAYEANFFLFATLENARPIAHGRVQQAPVSAPVLTGMPVSGMAYLDRPWEAGYFIFPDLSVRHEGKYKLSFNLYEQTKHLEEDGDAEPQLDKQHGMPMATDVDSSFDWRMEVKSEPFQVYSAKKFPGLAESTPLSRTVAEQGCRVRIRRDVRMRRRGDGGKGGYGDFEDPEDQYARRPSVEVHLRERSRSLSGHSEADYRVDAQGRRITGEPAAQPGHILDFVTPSRTGGPAFAQPQLPSHQSYPPSQGPAPSAHYYPPPPPPPQYAQPPPPPPPPAAQHAYPQHERSPFSYSQTHPHSHLQPAHPSSSPREPDFASAARRDSAPSYITSARSSISYPPFDSYRQDNRGYNQPASPPHALAPLRMHPEPRAEYNHPSTHPLSIQQMAPPTHSPTYARKPDYSYPTPAGLELDMARKRDFGDAFPRGMAAAQDSKLQNGMRPSISHSVDDEDESTTEAEPLVYKRAAGQIMSRLLPNGQ